MTTGSKILDAALLLGLAACATATPDTSDREEDVFLPGATLEIVQAAARDVLEEAGFFVEQRGATYIAGTTGGGLAPDSYGLFLSCGTGESVRAAGIVLQEPGVERPTGRFEIRLTPLAEGVRMTITPDFVADACWYGTEGRECRPILCEATGLLEERITSRIGNR